VVDSLKELLLLVLEARGEIEQARVVRLEVWAAEAGSEELLGDAAAERVVWKSDWLRWWAGAYVLCSARDEAGFAAELTSAAVAA
jgi:hypothetical protein